MLKNVSLKLILQDKGGKQHCLSICWFWPGGRGIFLKNGTSEKRCVEIEDWRLSVHFLGGFKKVSFTLYFYVLAKIFQNHAKFTKKTDSWYQKSHEEFGQLQTSSGKSKTLKFDGLFLSKKYISSAKAFI